MTVSWTSRDDDDKDKPSKQQDVSSGTTEKEQRNIKHQKWNTNDDKKNDFNHQRKMKTLDNMDFAYQSIDKIRVYFNFLLITKWFVIKKWIKSRFLLVVCVSMEHQFRINHQSIFIDRKFMCSRTWSICVFRSIHWFTKDVLKMDIQWRRQENKRQTYCCRWWHCSLRYSSGVECTWNFFVLPSLE